MQIRSTFLARINILPYLRQIQDRREPSAGQAQGRFAEAANIASIEVRNSAAAAEPDTVR